MAFNRRSCLVIALLVVVLLAASAPGAMAAPLVRVGLSVKGSAAKLGGTGVLLDPQGNIVAHLTGPGALELTVSQGQVWLDSASFSWLRAVPASSGSQTFLQVNGKAYRGELVVSASAGGIKIVNELDVEDYLLGVVALEMTPTWPVEALKAQAVAARTFALKNLDRHQADGFDLCDTSHCQIYGGVSAERPTSSAAVEGTNTMVLRYGGELIEAYYHASSGGRTETAGDAWGQDRPYLMVVEDGAELAGPDASWQVSFSPEQLSERLAEAGYAVGSLQQVEVVETTSSGRAATVQVSGSYGTVLIPGARFRQALDLKSTLFDVNANQVLPSSGKVAVWTAGGNGAVRTTVAGGTYVVTAGGTKILDSRLAADSGSRGGDRRAIVLQGSGYGHGVGMSQWGVKALAENQSATDTDSFRQILTHYYKGVTIEPY